MPISTFRWPRSTVAAMRLAEAQHEAGMKVKWTGVKWILPSQFSPDVLAIQDLALACDCLSPIFRN